MNISTTEYKNSQFARSVERTSFRQALPMLAFTLLLGGACGWLIIGQLFK